MDYRKIFFQNLIDQKFDNDSVKKLNLAIKNNLFVKGVEKKDKTLIKTILKSKNHHKKINKVISHLKRPIDTIKHQAKTITVGTQRIEQNNLNFNFSKKDFLITKNNNFYFNEINKFCEKNFLDTDNKKNIFLYGEDFDESIIYFAVSFLNTYAAKFNLRKNFHLARSYDINSIIKAQNSLIINLNHKIFKNKISKHLNILFTNQIQKNNKILCLKRNQSFFGQNISQALDIYNFCNSLLLSLIDKSQFNYLYNKLFELKKFLYSTLDTLNNSKIPKVTVNAINDLINEKNNIKFIGSGVNYNLSKISSKLLSKRINKACAYDVLENHKHIDMSAEPLLFVLISNINNSSYQMDAKSEIEKFISHGNVPILFVNSGDKRFDNLKVSINGKIKNIITIKTENLYEDISFIPSLLLIENIISQLKT